MVVSSVVLLTLHSIYAGVAAKRPDIRVVVSI